jgi:hypothetical protein
MMGHVIARGWEAMTDTLFARRLRDFRGSSGAHGRLTQEQLAEMLGVSVDAIGKYERSLSYIRGDLEHRLSEQLGWSREEVLACREDWESRARQSGSRYRVMDNAAPDAIFGGSLETAISANLALATRLLGDLPDQLEVNRDVFAGSMAAFPENWTSVLSGGEMVASWSLIFLLPEDVALFRRGALDETTLTSDRLRRAILPGRFFGYCPGLLVAPGHEAVSHLLLQSFVGFLEDTARRGVILDGIGTISVSEGGAQVCRDLGMVRLCDHVLSPSYGCWELPGAGIPASIFGRRSRLVRRAYSEAFGPPASRASSRA